MIQWLIATGLIVAQGNEWLDIDNAIFISFFASIIIQTIAIILAMVAYLFKDRSSAPLDVIKSIMSTIGENNNQYDKEDNDNSNKK